MSEYQMPPVFRKRFFAVLLLTVGMCVTYSWLVLSTVVRIERQAILSNQLEITQMISERIDHYLQQNFQSLQFMVLNHGLMSSNTDRHVRQLLQRLNLLSGTWDSLIVLDLHGKIIASDRDLSTDSIAVDKETSDIYQAALSGQPAYSDFFHSKISGKPTIAFAAPILGTDNITQEGVLLGFVSWSQVTEFLAIVNTMQTAIINSHNTIIALHAPQQVAFATGDVVRSEFIEPIRTAGNFSNTVLGTRSLFGRRGYLTAVNESGYFSFAGNKWIVVVEQPVQGVFGEGNQRIITLTFIFIVMSLLLLPLLLICRKFLFTGIRANMAMRVRAKLRSNS